MRLPTVFFAEGGGGRPGDTDYPVVSALDTRAFALWARLSGVVPRIAVVDGPLLRRQRGDRRLLGPDRGDREHLARHGRAGDDRGRRARRRRPRRRRARSRCRRPTASSTSSSPTRPRRSRWPSGCSATSRAATALAARPTRRRCATLVPERAPARLRRRADRRDARRRRLGDVPARALRARDGHGAGADRGPPGRRHRQQHDAPGRRDHRATPPTRPRASCSCATRSGCRSSRSSTRPGSWSGPRPRRPAWSATARGMLVAGAALRVPLVAVILRRGYGLGAQAMVGRQPARAAADGRLAAARTSARWGSRARCGSACGASSRRSPTTAEREQRVRELDGRRARERQGAQRRARCSSSTT